MKKYKFNIDYISKKDKIILVCTILIVLFFIYFKFLLIPKINILQKNIQLYKNAKDQYTKEDLYKEENEILKDKLNNLEKECTDKNKQLPNTANIAKVIRELKVVSDKNQVDIESLNNTNENIEYLSEEKQYTNDNNLNKSNQENINNLDVESEILNLKVTGSYENITSFIQAIENHDRIIGANNINFTKNSELLICTFDIEFYYLTNNEGEKYDFNKGNYGKKDLFN